MASAPKMVKKAQKIVAGQTAKMLAMMTSSAVRKARPKGGPAKNAALPAGGPPAPPNLAENLPYVAIPLSLVAETPADLGDVFKTTGHWLHVIRAGEKATHFSISDADNNVLTVCRGALAQKVYDAIVWLDGTDAADNEDPVCVFTIPALYVHGIGINRKKGPTAVVVAGPDKLVGKAFKEKPLATVLKQLREGSADSVAAQLKVGSGK